MSVGIGYNPFDFVRDNPKTGHPSERDIMRIANALCPLESLTEPFWEGAAKDYLAMLTDYVLEFLPESEQNLATVVELISGLVPQGEELPQGTTGKLLEEIDCSQPNCLAARKWRYVRGKSVVLQSITQLETIYGRAQAKTIVNGCDHLLYLGGQDIETADFIAKKAGRTLDTILQQGIDMVWLFERGKRGEMVKLFDLTAHELYGSLPEAEIEWQQGFGLAG